MIPAMQGPNFNALMNPMSLQQTVSNAFVAGRNFRKEVELEKALADYQRNPADENAIGTITQLKPELGMKFQDRRDDAAFRGAASEYLMGGTGGQGVAPPSGPVGQPGAGGQADPIASLGQPRDGRDAAFLKMMRIDPIQAMKIRSGLRDDFAGQLESQRELFDWSVSRFAGITDETGYQAARTELAGRLGGFGAEGEAILSQLPPNYPGPEALGALRLRALDAKDQIAHFQRQAAIEADDARADRNTASLIEDRERRAARQDRNTDSVIASRGAASARQDRNTASLIDSRGIKRVKSVEEARRLPKGTRFMTPDGVVKVR